MSGHAARLSQLVAKLLKIVTFEVLKLGKLVIPLQLLKVPNKLVALLKSRSGKVSIKIGAQYDLKDAVQAHKDLEARKTTGCIILRP